MTFAQIIHLYTKHVSFVYHGKSEAQIVDQTRDAIRSAIKATNVVPVSRDLLRELRGELMQVSRYCNGMARFQ